MNVAGRVRYRKRNVHNHHRLDSRSKKLGIGSTNAPQHHLCNALQCIIIFNIPKQVKTIRNLFDPNCEYSALQ
ncbi:hypothetical protein ACTXT7_006303 [Hymenolepis weldensis]